MSAGGYLATYGVLAIICGLICSGIGTSKNRSGVAFFFLGLLLGVIGLILALTSPTDAPKGMKSLTCPRCNARQNVPESGAEYECWQCHTMNVLQ